MLIIGHRGAKGLAPENTIESIKAGLANGADAIEIDVRVTKDGIPVLSHDDYLNETGYRLAIDAHDFLKLKGIKADLATLDEAMRYLKGKTLVIVEIKPGEEIQPVVDCLKNRLNNGWKASKIRIASFDFKILRQIKQELPTVEIVVNEKWSGVRAGRRCRKLDAKHACMNQKWLWSGFIKSVNRSGIKLSAYTLNDPAKAIKWAKNGLYGVVTDFPDRF